MGKGPRKELPVAPRISREAWWRAKFLQAQHRMRWTGRRFICIECLRSAGPSRVARWLQEGQCPGTPVVRRSAFFLERPFPRLRTQRAQDFSDLLVGVVRDLEAEPMLPTSARRAAGLRQVHPSHRVSCRGAYTWCRRCGAFTTGLRVRLLAQECTKPRTAGRLVLSRVRLGLPPLHTATEWGDEVVPGRDRSPSDEDESEEEG